MSTGDSSFGFRRAALAGYAAIVLFAGSFAVWSATMPIKGAVIASGQFVAETNLKKVQHLQGGIVASLAVREGQTVREGELLLTLDATQARAMVGIFSRQLDEFTVRTARLEAERDDQRSLVFPETLISRAAEPDAAAMMAAEKRLFEARISARDGTRSVLSKRITQLRAEIEGYSQQRAAKSRESGFITNELAGVRGLFDRNLVQISRLSQLEREAASLEGQQGMLTAQIAQAEGRIAEVEQQMIQIGEDLRSESMKELRDIQGRVGELQERRTAAEDQLKRIDLRAPSSGIVHQLQVHTVGGVVAPGEAVMMIVPSDELLHLEAKVAPMDYDQVQLGQAAKIKLMAFNQRTTPELNGTISRLSADVVREQQTGLVYYVIRVAIPQSELDRIAPLRIAAGMQAEVFLQTDERSAASYLVRPMLDQFARTFRER
jgi:HlyD family secretion protein